MSELTFLFCGQGEEWRQGPEKGCESIMSEITDIIQNKDKKDPITNIWGYYCPNGTNGICVSEETLKHAVPMKSLSLVVPHLVGNIDARMQENLDSSGRQEYAQKIVIRDANDILFFTGVVMVHVSVPLPVLLLKRKRRK